MDRIPDALRERATFLLGVIYRHTLTIEAAELAEIGLEIKQQGLLSVIADEGPMAQGDLAARVGIDRTTAVAVVDDLESAGLIERQRDRTDRRAYQIVLTHEGRRLEELGADAVARGQRFLLRALPPAEQAEFVKLLYRCLTSTR